MNNESKTTAYLVCVVSFFTWGMLALYWSALKHVSAPEIVAHRAIWSVAFSGMLVVIFGYLPEVVRAFTNVRLLLSLAASSLFIALNWGLYIWAVTHNHIVETSMGYYINPLFNILASALIFKVKLDKVQMLAIAFAMLGVAILVIGYGKFPLVAICLALSFCLYGVIRKIIPIDALPGHFVETVIIGIPSAIYIIFLTSQGLGAFALEGGYTITLLVLGGVVTTLPLVGFAYGARHLDLSTVGVLQYLSPTTSFCIGIFVFNEVFTTSHLLSFICIWIGLLIYTIDAIVIHRRNKQNK